MTSLSRDRLIAHMPFAIGSPLEQSLYLQPFSRYCTLSVLESPFKEFDLSWSPDVIGHMAI